MRSTRRWVPNPSTRTPTFLWLGMRSLRSRTTRLLAGETRSRVAAFPIRCSEAIASLAPRGSKGAVRLFVITKRRSRFVRRRSHGPQDSLSPALTAKTWTKKATPSRLRRSVTGNRSRSALADANSDPRSSARPSLATRQVPLFEGSVPLRQKRSRRVHLRSPNPLRYRERCSLYRGLRA